MSDDNVFKVPVNPETNAFMEMAYGTETEWMCVEETRLGLLVANFILVLESMPAVLSPCSMERMAEVMRPDAVVGGAHWIRMPNFRFCSPECCKDFVVEHKQGLTGQEVQVCDVCRNAEAPHGECEVLVYENVLIVTVCCEACRTTDPSMYAYLN